MPMDETPNPPTESATTSPLTAAAETCPPRSSCATSVREFALVLLALLGLADTAFIFVQEQHGVIGQMCTAFAGDFGANCEKVFTSRYATVGGIGLAIWGIFYYLSLFWVAAWARLGGSERVACWLMASISTAGVVSSAYLTYLQAAVIRAWCPFCLVSAGITVLFMILSIWHLIARERTHPASPEAEEPARVSTGVPVLVFLCVILASALAVVLMAGGPKRTASTFEEMSKYIPRRITPPGGLVYGGDSTLVTVQAFLDFTCQHCREFEKDVFPRIKAGYIDNGRVRWISKLLPHADEGAPMLMAMAAAAGRDLPQASRIEGAFFQYPIPSPKTGFDALQEAMAMNGVDSPTIEHVLRNLNANSPAIQEQVVVEVRQALSYGLKGPPAFVIDGIAYQGTMDYATLSDMLEVFLKQH